MSEPVYLKFGHSGVWSGWPMGTCHVAQGSVIIYIGKEPEKEWMCVYIKLNHFVVRLKLLQH